MRAFATTTRGVPARNEHRANLSTRSRVRLFSRRDDEETPRVARKRDAVSTVATRGRGRVRGAGDVERGD